MLPLGSPSYEVAGTVVFDVEDITEGVILLTDQTVRSVEQEAAERGAAGVISTYLLPYAVDPTGEDRHFDAIFTGSIRPGSELPSMYVSPRTGENVRQAHRAGSTFELAGSATTTVRPLRTLVAELEGSDQIVCTRPDGDERATSTCGSCREELIYLVFKPGHDPQKRVLKHFSAAMGEVLTI